MFRLLTTKFVLPVSVQSVTFQQCQGHSVISSDLIISSNSGSPPVEADTWCTSRTTVGFEHVIRAGANQPRTPYPDGGMGAKGPYW